MKRLIRSLLVATLVSTPAMSADVPSLVGTWTGQRDQIAKVEGRRGGLATLVITEQQGSTFVGHLKRSNPTGDEDEPLWGRFHARRSAHDGIGRGRILYFPSHRREHPRLLLQRERPFCTLGVRQACPAALILPPHNCDRRASAARLERCGRLLGLKRRQNAREQGHGVA